MPSKSNLSKRTILFSCVLLLVLSSLVLSACSPMRSAPEASVERAVMEAPAAPAMEMDSSGGAGNAYSASVPQQEVERIVIRNVSLSLVVDDPVVSMDKVSNLADQMGGFVVNANLYQTELDSGVKVPRATITIRVPAERLKEALSKIKAESARDPLSEVVDSQDVTREYTDLQSRLRNLEEAEAQLRDIMDEAFRTEDVLNVYNQLVQVREQIEVIKGQIQYYQQASALSAISVELVPNEIAQPLTIGGWQPVGVAKDAVQALINTLKGLANFVIWLVIFILPVLLVLYLVFFLPLRWIWRKIRRGRAARKAPPAPPTPPAA